MTVKVAISRIAMADTTIRLNRTDKVLLIILGSRNIFSSNIIHNKQAP